MEDEPEERLPTVEAGPRPRAWDGFVTGPENAMAHAAVLAMARGEPGVSPLVIHGPAGSGKSRLLDGLVAETLERTPGASIARLDGEAFAAACSDADDSPGGWIEFRARFRALDLLCLDDAPALARSPLAIAELGPTLDALDDRGAPVALAAADAPSAWENWPPRLLDRLLGGLVVRVERPGIASLRRFVIDRSRSRGLRLPADVVEALASTADDYRSLEGRLARLALMARVDRRPVDLPMALGALAEDGLEAVSAVPVADVLKAVASRFGLRVRDLRSEDRHRGLIVPRHLAILLARELTGLSFSALGRAFGNRDTKTIRHACSITAKRLATDPSLAAAADAIRRKLRQPGG